MALARGVLIYVDKRDDGSGDTLAPAGIYAARSACLCQEAGRGGVEGAERYGRMHLTAKIPCGGERIFGSSGGP